MGDELTSGVRLRKATVKDLDALMELEKKGFMVDLFDRNQIRYLLTKAKSSVIIIEVSSAVAGAAIMLWKKGVRSGRLYNIVIDPSRHGQGLGNRLMQACEQEAGRRGCSSVTLEVRTDNSKAISLYLKNGYVRVKTIPGYYSDGVAALKMKKKLSS